MYFKSAVHLSPAATNSVLAATPMFLAPFSFLARHAGRHVGAHHTWHADNTGVSFPPTPSQMLSKVFALVAHEMLGS